MAFIIGAITLKRAIGKSGIELIKEFEGFRAKAYRDVAGYWTIGYGHLIKPGEMDKYLHREITEAEGEKILREDVKSAEASVKKFVKVPLTQGQFDALVSFTFNLGPGNLSSSTLLKKLNAGDYQGASLELRRWNRAGGKVYAGLVRRREAEQNLFWS